MYVWPTSHKHVDPVVCHPLEQGEKTRPQFCVALVERIEDEEHVGERLGPYDRRDSGFQLIRTWGCLSILRFAIQEFNFVEKGFCLSGKLLRQTREDVVETLVICAIDRKIKVGDAIVLLGAQGQHMVDHKRAGTPSRTNWGQHW